MSGANYNVSVTQVMESEKKLRIMSVMKIVTCGDGTLTLRDFIKNCNNEMDASENCASVVCPSHLVLFKSVVDDCDNVVIAQTEMSGIVFVAGYVGFKLKNKIGCIDCRFELLTERALECDFPQDESFNYMANIDRGGLTWPTDLLVDIVAQTVIIFKCLVSSNNVTNFNTPGLNQRSVMMSLASQRCSQVISLTGKCSTCGVLLLDIAKMCIKTVSNISLNNYSKKLADSKSKSKTMRKLSTLTK